MKAYSNRFLFPLLALFTFILSSPHVYSQFTYLEGGISLHSMSISEDAVQEYQIRSLNFEISAIRRILRPVGIGAEISLPFARFGATEQTSFSGSYYSYNFNTDPSEFSRSVQPGLSGRLLFRIYFGDNITDFYLEGRYGFGSVKEEFTFVREGFTNSDGTFPAVEYNLNESRSYTSPGIGFGYQYNFEDKWMFKARTAWDFVSFADEGFTYDIYLGENFVQGGNSSLVPATATTWFVDVGVSYFF